MSHWSAQAYCAQQLNTSYLIEILSQAEFDWIKTLAQPSLLTEAWVSYKFFFSKY